MKNFDQFLKEFDGYEFFVEGGRAVCYFLHQYLIQQYVLDNPEWPMPNVDVLSNCKEHNAKWFRIHKSLSRYSEEFDKFFKDLTRMSRLHDYITTSTEEVVSKLKDADYSTITNNELLDLLQYFIKQYINILRSSSIIRLVDVFLVPKLKEKFKDRQDSDSLIQIVSSSDKPSLVLSERIDMLKLAAHLIKQKIDIDSAIAAQELTKIKDNYCWIGMGYYDEPAKTLESYQKELKLFMEQDPEAALMELERGMHNQSKERENVLQTFDDQTRAIASLAVQSSDTKDHFKASINKATYFAQKMFEEIAHRTGRTVDNIKDLSTDEISHLLHGKAIDENIVRDRTRHHILICFRSNFYTLVGHDADVFEEKYLQAGSQRFEFKGRCASSGHGKGKAKVILNTQQFSKMNEGDILVVMNTSPDFTPIMRKAAAIVAEEGGITAHVSIVSREMKIPAVVGIHHITAQIKDNDVVEVDAEKGIVKILK